MATASTINDTMPTPWDGKKRWNGKKNPVTFVSTVVTRNSAVQASRRFAASKPNTTTNPDKIPIKLNATCTKVSVVTPKIMMPPQPETHLRVIRRTQQILLTASRRNFQGHSPRLVHVGFVE